MRLLIKCVCGYYMRAFVQFVCVLYHLCKVPFISKFTVKLSTLLSKAHADTSREHVFWTLELEIIIQHKDNAELRTWGWRGLYVSVYACACMYITYTNSTCVHVCCSYITWKWVSYIPISQCVSRMRVSGCFINVKKTVLYIRANIYLKYIKSGVHISLNILCVYMYVIRVAFSRNDDPQIFRSRGSASHALWLMSSLLAM